MSVPRSLGFDTRPDCGGCRGFSTRSCPVNASNDRKIAPPGPDSEATTIEPSMNDQTKYDDNKNKERTIFVSTKLYYVIWRLEYIPPS